MTKCPGAKRVASQIGLSVGGMGMARMNGKRAILDPCEGKIGPSPKGVYRQTLFGWFHLSHVGVRVLDTKVVEIARREAIVNVKQIANIFAIVGFKLGMCGIPDKRLDRSKDFPRRLPDQKALFGECIHAIVEAFHCITLLLKEAFEFRGLGPRDVGIHGPADGIGILQNILAVLDVLLDLHHHAVHGKGNDTLV